MGKIFDFRWRYKTPERSIYAKVFEYISNQYLHPANTKNDLILKALCAFYIPEALIDSGQPQDKQAVINSLKILYNQFFHLCYLWKIDPGCFTHINFSNNPANFQVQSIPDEHFFQPDVITTNGEKETDERCEEIDEEEVNTYITNAQDIFAGLNFRKK